MDDLKKQRVSLAVLAVFVLGAGSYFVVLRDSGPDTRPTRTDSSTVRKERGLNSATAKGPATKKDRAERHGAKGEFIKSRRKGMRALGGPKKGRDRGKPVQVKKSKPINAA